MKHTYPNGYLCKKLNRVQILGESFWISLCDNALIKGMKLSLLLSNCGK